jgi:ribosomal protein L37AE/L43A
MVQRETGRGLGTVKRKSVQTSDKALSHPKHPEKPCKSCGCETWARDVPRGAWTCTRCNPYRYLGMQARGTFETFKVEG